MTTHARMFSLVLLGAGALFAVRTAEPTSRPDVTGSAAVAGTSLTSESLYDGAALSLPTRIAVAGDHLVVLDVLGGNAVHVIDRRSGALVESFGGRGDGPGEFRGARSIDVLPGAEAFWVHDMSLQRSTLYSLDPAGMAEGRSRRESEVLTFDGAGVLEPIHVSDDRIMAGGAFTRGRIGHLSRDGRLLRESGELPGVPEGLPPHELQFVHQGALRGTPSRDRFALSSLAFTRIELYDRQGVRRALVQPPVELEPELMTRGEGEEASIFVSPESPHAYTDVAVTDAAIYALFSGRDPSVHREEAPYARQVHVFTWTGEFVAALDLDYDAAAIAVSPDGRDLYGLRHHPAPEIRRHVLPQRFTAGGSKTEM